MVLRIALFALMAVGLLGFGAVAWFSTLPPPQPEPAKVVEAPPPPPPPPPAKASMLVAAHQLRAGTFIKADDVRADQVLASEMPPGAAPDNPVTRGQLQGAMLRHSIGEGQALLPNDVLRPGDHGFLAAVLEPGMRAMTISVGDVASDWGLIWPGDHIDLILTQSFDAADTMARRHFAAETVLADIRIVAVDQQLMQGEMADDAERKTMRTLTVEVSPDQAQRLVVALRLGKLGIALRSAANPRTTYAAVLPATGASLPQAPPAPQVTWSGDVARALTQPTREPGPAAVQTFHGVTAGARS